MEVIHPTESDTLSNLRINLIAIERAEGDSTSPAEFEMPRCAMLDAVETFQKSRLRLGLALVYYRRAYKQECIWLRAQEAIAHTLALHPKTVTRFIDAAEHAAPLGEFTLQAAEDKEIDLGKERHSSIVKELLVFPPAQSHAEAETRLTKAIENRAHTMDRQAVPVPIPMKKFIDRLVKLCSAFLEGLAAPARTRTLRYCFEAIATATKTDVPPLRRYGRMSDVPQPDASAETLEPPAA